MRHGNFIKGLSPFVEILVNLRSGNPSDNLHNACLYDISYAYENLTIATHSCQHVAFDITHKERGIR